MSVLNESWDDKWDQFKLRDNLRSMVSNRYKEKVKLINGDQNRARASAYYLQKNPEANS